MKNETKQSRKTGKLPALSNAEWEVMKPFWDKGPMPARDVYAALPKDHGWAIKTVKTLLARLVIKGALAYEQIGNSYLYRPLHSREELTRDASRGFARRVLDGAVGLLIAQFIEESSLSDEEIAELREALRKKEDANERNAETQSRKEKR